MDYQHGTPFLGIVTQSKDFEAYKKEVTEYIIKELSIGNFLFTIRNEQGWTLADPSGRPLNLKDPNAPRQARFIHKIEAIHEWELPANKTRKKPLKGRDRHNFYFDATKAIPADLAKKILEKAGYREQRP